MSKDDYKYLISIISTLIVTVISSCIFQPLIQILFIFIFILICILSFSNLNHKEKRKQIFLVIGCVIECLIIAYSIATIGSISSFFEHIGNFFIHSSIDNNDFADSLEVFNEQVLEIKKSIEGMNGNITEIDESIYMLANELGNPYVNAVDENEVSEILQQIENEYDNYDGDDDFFLDLKTDPYLIELFYKMYIAYEPYCYCNIVIAFNEYGVNIEKLGISENDLLIWDIEMLYNTYNIKKSIANELESEEIINKKEFMYNDFRVNMNRISDTFDYGNWRKYYTNCTPKQIDDGLNDTIMMYYKKFIINFTTE